MKKELICIVCPIGCHMEAELDDNGTIIRIEGNTCKRGETYARAELIHPMRMLTSTVHIKNSIYHRLPVVTSQVIPKDKMFDVMNEINKIEVNAPIQINDIIIENVCGLNTNIIASRSMNHV